MFIWLIRYMFRWVVHYFIDKIVLYILEFAFDVCDVCVIFQTRVRAAYSGACDPLFNAMLSMVVCVSKCWTRINLTVQVVTRVLVMCAKIILSSIYCLSPKNKHMLKLPTNVYTLWNHIIIAQAHAMDCVALITFASPGLLLDIFIPMNSSTLSQPDREVLADESVQFQL